MPVDVIRKDIILKPEYFTKDYKDHILDNICNELTGQCDMEKGYIVKTLELNKIIDNTIGNSSSEVVVNTEISVEIFKPKKGMKCNAVVNCIYNDGILATIKDIQNILIPPSSYSKKYAFEHGKLRDLTEPNMFVKKDSKITVRITAVRYNDHSFSCIGELA